MKCFSLAFNNQFNQFTPTVTTSTAQLKFIFIYLIFERNKEKKNYSHGLMSYPFKFLSSRQKAKFIEIDKSAYKLAIKESKTKIAVIMDFPKIKISFFLFNHFEIL